MPSPEQIALIYRSLPAERWLTGRKEVNSWEHAIRWLVSNFSRDKSLRILDVGTFDGRFLLELPVAWNKYCLEPSECNRQQLENNGIHRVGDFISDLSTSQQKPFDVITMFDVFEHLDNPRESLSQLVRHLAPNGYLIISTADSEHWSWNLRGDHWYVQSIQHLIVGGASFFQYAVKDLECRLVNIMRHSHMRHSLRERFRQSIETIEFLSRRSDGVCRLLSFGIRQLPGFRNLIHRTTAPHGSGLSDHLLVILQRNPTTSKTETPVPG